VIAVMKLRGSIKCGKFLTITFSRSTLLHEVGELPCSQEDDNIKFEFTVSIITWLESTAYFSEVYYEHLSHVPTKRLQ
jgi:hypothetical protein